MLQNLSEKQYRRKKPLKKGDKILVKTKPKQTVNPTLKYQAGSVAIYEKNKNTPQ